MKDKTKKPIQKIEVSMGDYIISTVELLRKEIIKLKKKVARLEKCECKLYCVHNPLTANEALDIISDVKLEPKEVSDTGCGCCGGNIKIRNPKGYCDHLYYPENCSGKCEPTNESWEERWQDFIDDNVVSATADFDDTSKDFISNELLKQRQEIIEEIKGMFKNKPDKFVDIYGEYDDCDVWSVNYERFFDDLLERLEKDK